MAFSIDRVLEHRRSRRTSLLISRLRARFPDEVMGGFTSIASLTLKSHRKVSTFCPYAAYYKISYLPAESKHIFNVNVDALMWKFLTKKYLSVPICTICWTYVPVALYTYFMLGNEYIRTFLSSNPCLTNFIHVLIYHMQSYSQFQQQCRRLDRIEIYCLL